MHELINTTTGDTLGTFKTLDDAEVALTMMELEDCRRKDYQVGRYDVVDARLRTADKLGDKICEAIFCGLVLVACPVMVFGTIYLGIK